MDLGAGAMGFVNDNWGFRGDVRWFTRSTGPTWVSICWTLASSTGWTFRPSTSSASTSTGTARYRRSRSAGLKRFDSFGSFRPFAAERFERTRSTIRHSLPAYRGRLRATTSSFRLRQFAIHGTARPLEDSRKTEWLESKWRICCGGRDSAPRPRTSPSSSVPISTVIDYLVDYERQPDDVDSRIGQIDHVSVTTRGGQFSPNTDIEDARQRWLFRMVHSQRPLQEKMALFWHNHFATGYSKIAGAFGTIHGTKMMALKQGALPGRPGQIELFRRFALGNFRNLLIEVARDRRCSCGSMAGRMSARSRRRTSLAKSWSCSPGASATIRNRTCTRRGCSRAGTFATQPAAFSPIRIPTTNSSTTQASTTRRRRRSRFRSTRRNSHDSCEVGDRWHARRHRFHHRAGAAPGDGTAAGAQAVEFLRQRARKPDPAFVEAVASGALRNGTEMKPVIRYILQSEWFSNPDHWHARYSWPAEFVVRAIREIGWSGFPLTRRERR